MKQIYNTVLEDLLKKVRAKGLPQDEEQAPANMIELQQDAVMEEKKTPADKAMETMPDDMKRNMAADNITGEEMGREGDESEDYNPECPMCSEMGMQCEECANEGAKDVQIPEEPDEIKSSIMGLLEPKMKSDKKTAFGGAMSMSMPKKSFRK